MLHLRQQIRFYYTMPRRRLQPHRQKTAGTRFPRVPAVRTVHVLMRGRNWRRYYQQLLYTFPANISLLFALNISETVQMT